MSFRFRLSHLCFIFAKVLLALSPNISHVLSKNVNPLNGKTLMIIPVSIRPLIGVLEFHILITIFFNVMACACSLLRTDVGFSSVPVQRFRQT